MPDDQPSPELAKDCQEENVGTQQSGRAATGQIARATAAERRQGLFLFPRIIWVILGIPEVLLALRFGLKLIGANPNSGFPVFIYGITDVFTAPFIGLLSARITGDSVLEVATLLAMAVYAQLFWGIITTSLILANQFCARTATPTNRTGA